jgi:predicted GNAT family N-acyltransferase
MPIVRIDHGSEAYRMACALRQEVLRQPLGLDLFQEDLDGEASQQHFGWFEAGELVACAIAVPQSATHATIRQMAVEASHRGKGYGSKLLSHIETQLVRAGYRTVSLHARETAVTFYEKAGYQAIGERFVEIGIAHFKMSKQLVSEIGMET